MNKLLNRTLDCSIECELLLAGFQLNVFIEPMTQYFIYSQAQLVSHTLVWKFLKAKETCDSNVADRCLCSHSYVIWE